MTPHLFTKIAIRILALFLVYRGLEFGISQMIQAHFAVGMMANYDTTGEFSAGEMIRSMWIMTGIGAIIPLLLAGALWFASPVLSGWVAGDDVDSKYRVDDLPLRATLLQTAAIIMIAMAASTLPTLVYGFQTDHRNDPSITFMTSRIFPDIIQFLGKVVVGGILLLVVKKKLLR